jgi:hypothetical protein
MEDIFDDERKAANPPATSSVYSWNASMPSHSARQYQNRVEGEINSEDYKVKLHAMSGIIKHFGLISRKTENTAA